MVLHLLGVGRGTSSRGIVGGLIGGLALGAALAVVVTVVTGHFDFCTVGANEITMVFCRFGNVDYTLMKR